MLRSLKHAPALLLALVLVVLGGLLAGCGDSGDGSNGGNGGASADQDITVGESFTYEGFRVSDGWTLEGIERSVNMENVTMAEVRGEVTNTTDEPGYALFELVFAQQGEQVSTVRCSSSKLKPGETGELLCPGLASPYPEDFDTIVARPISR